MRKAILFLIICLILFVKCISAIDFDPVKLLSPGDLTKSHSHLQKIKLCFKCHVAKKGVSDKNCLACHYEIKKEQKRKKSFHAKVKKPCSKCHVEHKGKGRNIIPLNEKKYDHKNSGFPLYGKHSKLKCNKCHKKYRLNVETGRRTKKITYLGLRRNCTSCHKNVHKSENKKFLLCTNCHTFSAWKKLRSPLKFNHTKETKYKLVGAHIKTPCVKCHKHKFIIPNWNDCTTCHKDSHKNVFGKDCLRCHSMNTFKVDKSLKGKFNHDNFKFKLRGEHIKTACVKCHREEKLTWKPTHFDECDDCHADPHDRQFINEKCSNCHIVKGFRIINIDHEKRNKFSLKWGHNAKCVKCHSNGEYKSNQPECHLCHENIHKNKFPEKKKYDKECDLCHVIKNWSEIKFDHKKQTKFEHKGKHKTSHCFKCHIEGKFKDTSNKCKDCHKDFHNKQFPDVNCDRCHVEESFKKMKFDHATQSRFVLKGEHIWQSCRHCHFGDHGGLYKFKNIECGVCHSDIHLGKYGKVCDKCHSEAGWRHVTYAHSFGDYYLGGVHDKLECMICHKEGELLTGEGFQCISCHKKDPHYGSLGGHCGDCHNQIEWIPSTFNHNRTGFDLDGAHRYVECDRCHKNRIYGGLPTDCYFCHQNDFAGSKRHRDSLAGRENCELCHFSTNWYPVRRRSR